MLITLTALLTKPKEKKFAIYIDSGILGNYDNAKLIVEKGCDIVMMCSNNKPSYLWKTMVEEMDDCDKEYFANNEWGVFISWKKNDGKNINFITSFPQLKNLVERNFWEKNNGKKICIIKKVPQVLLNYSKYHGFTDQRRASIQRLKPSSRAKACWRVKFNDCLDNLLDFSYNYLKLSYLKKYKTNPFKSKKEFITLFCKSVSPIPNLEFSENCLYLHKLKENKNLIPKKDNRQRCSIQKCKKKTTLYCQSCFVEEGVKLFICEKGTCLIEHSYPNLIIKYK